jgi:VanZ family protein
MSVSRGLRRLGLWLPPVAWMAIIFYFSSQTDPVPELTTRVWDKLLHVGAYAVLGASFCRALVGEEMRPSTALLLAVILATTYGAVDEVHQSFVPLREPDFADWVVDALGASIGAIGHSLGPLVAGR